MTVLLIAAKIINSAKIVIVPVNYIYELNFAKTFNNAINRNQVHLLFWSHDLKKTANFDLPVSDKFRDNTDACFNVKLLKAFGEYVEM